MMNTRILASSVCGVALLMVTGCERKPVAAPAQGPAPAAVPAQGQMPTMPVPTVSTPATPAEPGTVFIGTLSFFRDEAWNQQAPASKMRLAEFSTDDGCSIVIFDDLGAIKPGESPTDEMVKANLDRWASQVTGPDGAPATPVIEAHTAGDLALTSFQSTGTYQDGMPGGPKTPKAETTFRGLVVRTPNDLYFVRMIGPKVAMATHSAAWDRMRKSLRVN